RKTLLLDLGCGPGTVTRPLSAHFNHVIGIDPSPGMLAEATALTPPEEYPNITYTLSCSEALPFVAPGSVDMVVSAQASHWFNYELWFLEMERVVRPGGSVVCWGYKDCVVIGRPKASAVIDKYAYSKELWGGCWQQPGRDRVQSRYRCLGPEVGNRKWEGVQRWEYEPVDSGRLVKKGEGMLRRGMKLGELERYVRTWSAVHKWLETHPEEKSWAEGGEGDTVDEMMAEMGRVEGWWGVGEEGWKNGEWKEIEIEVEWGHGVVAMRRTEVV
ncbi:S-adenosyl-L-methionine-dependent methyltransferase, partial [Peziza echinospora]